MVGLFGFFMSPPHWVATTEMPNFPVSQTIMEVPQITNPTLMRRVEKLCASNKY
jgi:hypothetical protein